MSLEQGGVRVGDGLLDRTTLREDARLGEVTQIQRRPATGELTIVGTRAALYFPPRDGAARLVQFSEAAGEAELLEWPDGSIRYLDRGGGGWRTGALLSEDGRRLWQPKGESGMNDMAAGDVDGDGVLEFAVGYNGGGGIHLLDSAGRSLWRKDDANVWHVEIVDADGDGRPEIVHSNAGGELAVRGPDGKLLRRTRTEDYFSQFSLVRWPAGRTGLLHARQGMARIIDFDGRVRSRFDTPDTFLAEAHAVAMRLRGMEHLALLLVQSRWERSQLFLFDEAEALKYREVIVGKCGSIAAPDREGFLVGCGGRVYQYAPRS